MITTTSSKSNIDIQAGCRIAKSLEQPKSGSANKIILKKSLEQFQKPASTDSDDSKRVVIVSYNYAPMLNPRAFRWTAIAEQWAKEGKWVEVVCAWDPDLAPYEYKNQVHIHRVGSKTLERFRSLLKTNGRNQQIANGTNEPSARNVTAQNVTAHNVPVSSSATNGPISYFKSALNSTAHKLHDLTWKNIYWPDYATLWSKPAINKVLTLLNDSRGELSADLDETTLITVSDPFTSHRVGKALKSRISELNWVVDIGDPFCFRHDTPPNNHSLYRSYNYRYESVIFTEADSISVTTAATKDKYCELFPIAAEKVKVIPPLVTPSAAPQNSAPLGNSPALKALYTGTLYRGIRSPEYLLRLFSTLKEIAPEIQIELHFFGPSDDCKSIFDSFAGALGDSVKTYGLMSKDITVAAMGQADLLLSVGNTSPYQLPSKVVEYATSAKPILNISSIAADSSAEFFKSHPSALNLNITDNKTIKEHALSLQKFLNGGLQPAPVSYCEQISAQHSPETISVSYSDLLNSVNKNASSTGQTK